jgi:hypothetical protein
MEYADLHSSGGTRSVRVPSIRMAESDIQYYNLIHMLCSFNLVGSIYNLEKKLKERKQENIDYINSLEILKTIHLKNNIIIEPYTISYYGANRVCALGGYLDITVEQYFYSKHKFRLKYPQLPCIVVKGGMRANGTYHFSYFPFECLIVSDFD